jgi:tryptophan 2,3-dioxygenase
VDEARVRFELENHAHDLYDAFQAITFFHLDEMIRIIQGAHHAARARVGIGGVSGVEAARPEMGHDVLVSNLWEVRDLWDWLAPGCNDPATKEAARPDAETT